MSSLIFLALLALALPTADEVVLTPAPDGTPVIGPAIRAASPGAVIRLSRGVYREHIVLDKSITLTGDEGAVLDPSQPFAAAWEAAPAYGAGVFRTASARKPATLFIEGKILAEVDSERRETANEGRWFWKSLLANGMPRTGLHYVRGLWLYRRDEGALFIHLEGDANPASHTWAVVWERAPIVTLRNAQDATVRGLTLMHSYVGVHIGQGCVRCAVVGCRIGAWDFNGVELRGGAAESLVEDNDIFRDSYEDLTPQTLPRPSGVGIEVSRDWYEVWQIHKIAGLYDRVGISITLTGSANRIHANRIHDVFDGIDLGEGEIESLDSPPVDPAHDRDAEIWENVIERTGDSGIEVGGPAVNVRIHHNVLRRTHGGLRYKLPRIGPVFIYRNVLVDGAPNNIWYSMDDSPAEGYVYHNTVVGGHDALHYNGWRRHHDIGAPHWHYLNNLFVTPAGYFHNPDARIPVNFTSDYNVVQGDARPYPDDPSRDEHSRFVPVIELSPGFPPRPLPESPAVDAGLDLSTYFHGKPLPGCEPGYFKGKAPDVGAFEIR